MRLVHQCRSIDRAEVFAFTAFSKAHSRKIWSTTRSRGSIRKSSAVWILLNFAAVVRRVGVALIDMHDEWIAGDRHYLSDESMALLAEAVETGALLAAIEGDE